MTNVLAVKKLALAPALVLALVIPAAPAAAQNVAVRNATVLTVTNGTIENATVLIRNGKITAVGQNISIPASTETIDGTGMYVMPGIIDAHSHMAIEGGINEGTEIVTPEVIVPVRHDDMSIYRALAGGTTTAHLMHGSANAIGGQGALIKTKWGERAEDLLIDGAPRLVKFALGENPKRSRSAGNTPDDERRFPATRMGMEQVYRWWFTRASDYRDEWRAYDRGGRQGIAPRKDLRLDALVDIMEGDIKVHAHSYRADEILMLMRVAEEFGFRIHTFQHILEGYKVADEMREHGAMASTFADNWAYKVEAFDAIPHNMAIMTRRGIRVSVNSDSNERVRRLYQEAAMGMKYGGLSENEALALITINPAYQLGLESRIGSIEVGKDGDLAIFNNHPFAPDARVEKTIIEGQVRFDRDRAMTLEKLLDAAPGKPVTTATDAGVN